MTQTISSQTRATAKMALPACTPVRLDHAVKPSPKRFTRTAMAANCTSWKNTRTDTAVRALLCLLKLKPTAYAA